MSDALDGIVKEDKGMLVALISAKEKRYRTWGKVF